MGKKEHHLAYFEDLGEAKEFVWASYAYNVKVKDIYFEDGTYIVTVKGTGDDITELCHEFEVHCDREKAMDERYVQRELRLRTAAIAEGIAMREFIMAVVGNSDISDDLAIEVEDSLDEFMELIVRFTTNTRPGPKSSILKAYKSIIGDAHEGD